MPETKRHSWIVYWTKKVDNNKKENFSEERKWIEIPLCSYELSYLCYLWPLSIKKGYSGLLQRLLVGPLCLHRTNLIPPSTRSLSVSSYGNTQQQDNNDLCAVLCTMFHSSLTFYDNRYFDTYVEIVKIIKESQIRLVYIKNRVSNLCFLVVNFYSD